MRGLVWDRSRTQLRKEEEKESPGEFEPPSLDLGLKAHRGQVSCQLDDMDPDSTLTFRSEFS